MLSLLLLYPAVSMNIILRQVMLKRSANVGGLSLPLVHFNRVQ